jgi:hypothetical protein
MPGIQDPGQSTVAAPDLVSQIQPVHPVIGPDTVKAFTDAFRSGQITADDVLQRVDEVGRAKRKAELDIAKSAGSPEAAAARKSSLVAATQQAQLAGNSAAAESSMLPAHTQLAAGQLAQGIQEMRSGMPAATVRQLNLIYNLGAKFNDDGTLANPDEVFPNLTHVMGSLNGMQVAKELGTRVKTEPVTDAQGNTSNVPVWNATGKPLSPDEKSFFQRYQSMVPGMVHGAPGAVVTPNTGVQPTGGVVTPNATPGSAPTSSVSPSYPTDAEGNLVTKQLTDIERNKAAMDITKENRAQEPIKNWQISDRYYQNAKDAMSAINRVPLADQNMGKYNLGPKDQALAESVIKLLDPPGVVREFKWDKFESNQPWPEQVRGIMAKVKNEGKFTPGTRQELMMLANSAHRAAENGAADMLKQTQQMGGVLTDKEKALAEGNTTPVYTPPAWYQSPTVAGQSNAAQPAANSAAAPLKRQTPDGRVMVSADGGKTWNWVQ